MFSGIFSSKEEEKAQNFHPVTDAFKPSEYFGELQPADTEWACAGGFVTETQVYYHVLEDGTFLLCQVIYSSIGVWFPTIQFIVKVFNPTTKETTWKSINASNFASPPAGSKLDKRSCKADQFSITHNLNGDNETYTIVGRPTDDLQISIVVSRQAKGWKLGNGPKGGYSYFGSNQAKPEGFVVHRFWPRTQATGHVILNGKALAIDGIGMFAHAIQGMRPNLVAQRWNFANFQSKELGGVSAIQMEFTTIDDFGKSGAGSGGVKTNIGSLVVGNKLVAVSGETSWPGETPAAEKADKSQAEHIQPTFDRDTGYKQPSKIVFQWGASAINGEGPFNASLEVDVGGPAAPLGLLEKVDVLAEIPKVLKTVVNYVSGAKPYIYQWLNPTTLELSGPASVVPDGRTSVKGVLFNEASYVSNP